MRKVTLPFCMALALAALPARADSGTAEVLVLNLKDSRTVEFMLADAPEVTFVSDGLQITSAKSDPTVVYPLDNVLHFSFSASSGIESTVAPDVAFEITAAQVTVRSLDAGASVMMFDTAGRCVASANADSEGCATIDISALSAGVYVVTAEGTSYKLLKH